MRSAAAWNFHRIVPGEARVAELLASALEERIQSVPAQIAERIRADVAADFLDRVRGCEQFLARGRIDSVEARMRGRRRRDSHVDFARARLPQHRDNLAKRGAAPQRVLDKNDALVAP